MACPNINSPEWKALVGKIGVFEAMREFIKNNEDIPDASNYPETFKGVNATMKIVEALQRTKRQKYPSNQIQGFYNDLIKYGAPKNQIELLKQHIANNNITEINTNDLIVSLLSELPYTVEIETAAETISPQGSRPEDSTFQVGDYSYDQFERYDGSIKYVKYQDYNKMYDKESVISKEEYEKAHQEFEKIYKETLRKEPTQHYSYLTVPGGTNYTENEIRTPDITPSIKGHAQFATDNGIGWFRSDDNAIGGELITGIPQQFDEEGLPYSNSRTTDITRGGQATKIRRILEVQSDLFQKGREEKLLIPKSSEANTVDREIMNDLYGLDEQELQNKLSQRNQFVEDNLKSSKNQFLQLLNKDNNWVTFFIKSIIQDSAKKGYEKVLFPTGNTASKVEGHSTLEEFKKQKEDRIKELEEKKKTASNNKPWLVSEITNNKKHYFNTEEEANEFRRTNGRENFYSAVPTSSLKDSLKNIEDINKEINQLKQELERVEKEGFGALKPIYKFYEETVTNILKKQGYNPKSIKDEYDNSWFEIEILPKMVEETILFQGTKTEGSKASSETVNKLKEFLRRIGVDLKTVPYTDIYGNKLDYNGVARIMSGLVEIVEGKENVALAEEAMHFATHLIKNTNPDLYRQMFNRIEKYNIYKDVLDQYRDKYVINGKPDIPKIKFEAIGKLLAEYYIQSEEGVTEKPELLEQQKSWFEKVIEAIKRLFGIAGFNPFQEAINQLETLPQENTTKNYAETILNTMDKSNYTYPVIKDMFDNGKYSEIVKTVGEQLADPNSFPLTVKVYLGGNENLGRDIAEFFNNSVFLQLNSQELINKLDRTSAEVINKPTVDENGKPSNSYFIGTTEVKNRVTKLVKSIIGNKFKDRVVTAKQQNFEDQLKEWGSRGHRDMQALFKRYLTSEGKVVKDDQGRFVIQNNEPITSELDPANRGLFTQLENHVLDLLDSYPDGTIFRVEQTIYSNRGGAVGVRDIAGTSDFIAIQPNGKVDILDWKFTRMNTKDYDDIAWYKQNEWQLQMQEYKKILKRDYGLKDENFGKTRMIPFVLEYSGKTVNNKTTYFPVELEVADVNVRIDEKTYLLPVATLDETTGDEQLDKLIRSLRTLYNTIKDIPAPERQKNVKNEQLNKLFTAIRHLQVSKNLTPLTEQIGVIIKDTERVLKNHEKFKDLKDLTEQQISEHASELLLKAQALHVYRELDTTFNDFYGKEPSEKETEILMELDKMVSKARDSYKKIESEVKKFGEKYIAERRGVDQLLKAEKTVTGLTRQFGVTSELPTAALQTLFLMIDNANNKIQFDLNEVKDELMSLKKAVDDWGGLKKALPLLKKKGKNKLIDQYDAEFFAELKEAIEEKDVAWIKDNIDLDAYKEFLKRDYIERKAGIEQTPYSFDEEINEKKKKEALEELEKISNPNLDAAYLRYLDVKKFPKDSWYSQEYKILQQNEPVLKFFEFIQKINAEARELGYISGKNADRNFLPYLYKSFSEKIGMGGNFSIGDWLVNSLTIDENVAGYGSFNELTGQMEDTIPIYFTRKIENEDQISDDLFLNMAAYAKAVINFKYKTEIDGQVRALYFIEQNKASLQVNTFGNLVKVNGQVVEINKNDQNANLLLNHMKSLQYGQKYTGTDVLIGDWAAAYNKGAEKINKKLGFSIIPKLPKSAEGNQVSASRFMDAINRFFTLKNMGLNLATSISVYAGGNFQGLINSGKYYTKTDFLSSEFQHAGHKFFGNEKIHTALIKTFMPVDEELGRELNKLSGSNITGNNLSDFMMILMRKADHIIQYTNFLSFMKNTIIIDGNLYNAREYYRNQPEYQNRYNLPQAERKALEDKFEEEIQLLLQKNGIINKSKVDDKGNLTIEGLDNIKSDTVFKYRTLVGTVGRKATGNISPENEMLARMNAVTRSMMVFKNWIAPLVKPRFGGLKEDVATGTWEYGRVRMIIKHLGPLAILKINNIQDIIRGTDRGVELMKQYYQKQKESYENATNKDLDMTEAEFMDMFRQALRSQIKELFILLSLMGIVLSVLPMFKPDDDEEQEIKNRYKFIARMFDKVKDEVWFYYNPVGLQQILNGSIFPALGVFTDAARLVSSTTTEIFGVVTGDKELTEATNPLKNLMKSLPVTKEMIYYIAMFDADLAKELGIQLSSQSRLK